MVNRVAKVIPKIKQYDIIIENFTAQIFGANIDRPSEQTTKIHINHYYVTIKYLSIYCTFKGPVNKIIWIHSFYLNKLYLQRYIMAVNSVKHSLQTGLLPFAFCCAIFNTSQVILSHFFALEAANILWKLSLIFVHTTFERIFVVSIPEFELSKA